MQLRFRRKHLPCGTTCKLFGTTRMPTCICDDSNLPVFALERLACNTNVEVGRLVKATCSQKEVFRSSRRDRTNLPSIAYLTQSKSPP